MKRLLITFLATIPLPAPAAARAASGGTRVDPSIMQLPLEDNFTWSCWRIDGQTVCDGERHDSWTAADTGLSCPGDRSGRRGATLTAAHCTSTLPQKSRKRSLSIRMTGTTAQRRDRRDHKERAQ